MRPSHRVSTFLGALLIATPILSGCTGSQGSPVFGAVFGLEDGNIKPYRQGIIPEPEIGPGDELIGTAANSPGQCIYRRAGSPRRFEADCPEGYSL